MSPKKIILGVVLIIVVGLVVWFITDGNKSADNSSTIGTGLGADIYGQVAPNPAENIPDTNPFDKETNPFKAVETNPFE